MNYRKGLVAALFAPVISLGIGTTAAHAAGFALFTQGASALGQGNAVTAHTDSPNTIFFNPALMNKLDGTRLDIGTTFIFSSHDYRSSLTDSTSSDDSVFFPSTFYVSHKFNDSLSAGLGVFNPFGLSTDWPDDWEGRYIATKSELTTYNINPVVSYRIFPALSFAAGMDVIFLDATLQRQLPAAALGLTGPDLQQKFDGDGVGFGFNLAAAYDVTNDITVGVSYRSEVDVDIDGDASINGQEIAKGKTKVTLPAQVTAGVAYQVIDPLTVEVGLRWEGWSSYKNQTIHLDNGQTDFTPRNWHDTLGMNVGGKYRLSDSWAVMAGYIYGSNAVPSYTFDPSIPDSDTHIFCLGTDWNYRQWKVAGSYAYQMYVDRHKNNDVGSTFDVAPPFTSSVKANGKYENDAHLLAIELGYKF